MRHRHLLYPLKKYVCVHGGALHATIEVLGNYVHVPFMPSPRLPNFDDQYAMTWYILVGDLGISVTHKCLLSEALRWTAAVPKWLSRPRGQVSPSAFA
jgi:hypothetical protein